MGSRRAAEAKRWAARLVESMYIQTLRHILLSITLLAVPLAGIAQTRSSRPQQRQKKASTSRVTRQRVLSPREIVRLAFPSSASIYVLGENGDSSSGAGFVVAPGVVATCYHVVANARRIVVTPMGDGEDRHNARLLRYDDERDLALLAVPTLKGKPLKLSEEVDFYVGEKIYTLGNPKGLEGTFSDGILSNFLRVDDTIYMQFTAPVSPGSSGGPVLSSMGQVVGMVNMQFKEGQSLNFALMAFHVRMLMDGERDLPPDSYMDNDLGPPPSRRKPN